MQCQVDILLVYNMYVYISMVAPIARQLYLKLILYSSALVHNYNINRQVTLKVNEKL